MVFKKGYTPWNKGVKYTKEMKERIKGFKEKIKEIKK